MFEFEKLDLKSPEDVQAYSICLMDSLLNTVNSHRDGISIEDIQSKLVYPAFYEKKRNFGLETLLKHHDYCDYQFKRTFEELQALREKYKNNINYLTKIDNAIFLSEKFYNIKQNKKTKKISATPNDKQRKIEGFNIRIAKFKLKLAPLDLADFLRGMQPELGREGAWLYTKDHYMNVFDAMNRDSYYYLYYPKERAFNDFKRVYNTYFSGIYGFRFANVILTAHRRGKIVLNEFQGYLEAEIEQYKDNLEEFEKRQPQLFKHFYELLSKKSPIEIKEYIQSLITKGEGVNLENIDYVLKDFYICFLFPNYEKSDENNLRALEHQYFYRISNIKGGNINEAYKNVAKVYYPNIQIKETVEEKKLSHEMVNRIFEFEHELEMQKKIYEERTNKTPEDIYKIQVLDIAREKLMEVRNNLLKTKEIDLDKAIPKAREDLTRIHSNLVRDTKELQAKNRFSRWRGKESGAKKMAQKGEKLLSQFFISTQKETRNEKIKTHSDPDNSTKKSKRH